jgi:hypothetical protein
MRTIFIKPRIFACMVRKRGSEQNKNSIHCGDKPMSRRFKDLLALASCGSFVWMVWHAAFLVS